MKIDLDRRGYCSKNSKKNAFSYRYRGAHCIYYYLLTSKTMQKARREKAKVKKQSCIEAGADSSKSRCFIR
jgi:hypothetical protein